MKKLLLLVLLATPFAATAFMKKDKLRPVTVVRDCTGTYLRHNGKDYQVCNRAMTDSLSNGATLDAEFEKTKECSERKEGEMVCMMYHQNEGLIKIIRIKK